jgi:predicted  nucleic acid-binding Zn-ribbon protein
MKIKRFSLNFFIASLLMISLAATANAVDIKEVYAQYANSSFDLNKTIGVIQSNSDAVSETKEVDALKMELDFMKSNLHSLEPWYAADNVNAELQEKLQNVYLDALGIEMRSKLIRAKLIQQDLQSSISSARSKVDASKQLTSLSDSDVHGSETSLAEANRLLIQAMNITVDIPYFQTTSILRKNINMLENKLQLLEKGNKEINSSIAKADKILGKVQEEKIQASRKMQEFDEQLFQANASIEAMKAEGINTVFPESSMKQAQQIRSELEQLQSEERYEEILNKVPTGMNLIQKANEQMSDAKKEHETDQTNKMWAGGAVALILLGLIVRKITRPPDT